MNSVKLISFNFQASFVRVVTVNFDLVFGSFVRILYSNLNLVLRFYCLSSGCIP